MESFLSDDALLRRIERAVAALTVAVPAVAWIFFTASSALGVLIGALIAASSFYALKRQLRRAFSRPDKPPGKGGVFAGSFLRFLGSLLLVFIIVYNGWADPLFLLAGLSVVPFGILLVGGLELLILFAKKGEK